MYFAFFDVVRDRDLRPWRLVEAENEENAAVGQHGFWVKLVFRFEGSTYEVDRRVAPRRGIAKPTVDEDYERSWFLARDGDQLDSLEAARTMSRLLPQDVARFFLFDGELPPSSRGSSTMRTSRVGRSRPRIEMILGVPVLKAAVLTSPRPPRQPAGPSSARRRRTRETAQIGEAIRRTREARDAHIAERGRSRQTSGVHADVDEVDGYLRARDRYRDAMERRERAEKSRDAARDEEARLRDQLRAQMSDAWRTVLGDKVREARDAASDSVAGLIAEVALGLRLGAIKACHCGTCDQGVPPDVITRLEALLPAGARTGDTATPVGIAAFGRSKVLNAFRETDVRPAVTILAAGIERARMEQIARGDEIRDLDADLVHADEDTLRDKSTTRAALLAKIAGAEKAIEDETREIDAATASITRMNGLLEAAGDSPLAAFKRRAAFLTAAGDVFESSVSGSSRTCATRWRRRPRRTSRG